MRQPLLEVCELEVSYQGKSVVSDINFTLEKGEILGIVGESGSGKSTVMKAAMGLLGKEGLVTRGDVYYEGQNVIDCSREEQRRMRGPEMGMIFQNTGATLCPIRTIESQLYESVQEHTNLSKKEIKKQALELFSKMRLQDGERILKSYPFELSGGMNQRVGIMMAMILKPKLLFADEPTSALDVTVQSQVVYEMLQMRELYQTAIVLVTHNIGVVEKMADKVLVMHQGQVVEYGTKEQVIYHPKEEYTKKLLSSVLRLKSRRS